MELLVVALGGIGFAALVVLVWLALAHAELVRARAACDDAWRLLEAQLAARAEALPPFLVFCRESFGGEPVAALEAAHRGKKAGGAPGARATTDALAALLADCLRRPLLPEGFPEHKARLEAIEERLQGLGEGYNAAAARWNERLAELPDRWVARLEKAAPRELWKVA